MAAARFDGLFSDNETKEKIIKSEILLVGAGGIGCELLKSLVLIGFQNIRVIDLDIIDLSNLNRQFLFHKQHIGKSKSVIAKGTALKYNPKLNITAYHDSITSPKYNVDFYREFAAVVNALDNVGARSHVNRMCMAADIPLVESGSAGFLGQTTVYKKKITECFECLPKKAGKSYAGCTIRNTPSEPVHCIVWAKHLYVQLFGEADAEDDVSPDVADDKAEKDIEKEPAIKRVSTKEWAMSCNYDPQKIFQKLFHDDILYLRTMEDLWKDRLEPKTLDLEDLPDAVPGSSSQSTETEIQDCRKWSLKECGEIFVKRLTELRKRVEDSEPGTFLKWDKDDDICLDFVAACANLRSYCFKIEQLSRFDIKAIAGNIIPAIATTNAIVAGLVVLQLVKVLKGDLTKCRSSWINATYASSTKYISAAQLEKPNPLCLVCSPASNEVTIKINIKVFTLRTIEDKILKEKLHMVQPDVVINDGTGTILISSDPEEMSDDQYEKPLSSFNLDSDSRLLCEDFLQNFKVHLIILHDNNLVNQEFSITSDVDNIKPEDGGNAESSTDAKVDYVSIVKKSTRKRKPEDLVLEDEPELEILPVSDDENGVEPPLKKIKT